MSVAPAHEASLIDRTGRHEAARARARRAGIAAGRGVLLAVALGMWGYASGRLVDAEFRGVFLSVLGWWGVV
jgi:hypothetical protein